MGLGESLRRKRNRTGDLLPQWPLAKGNTGGLGASRCPGRPGRVILRVGVREERELALESDASGTGKIGSRPPGALAPPPALAVAKNWNPAGLRRRPLAKMTHSARKSRPFLVQECPLVSRRDLAALKNSERGEAGKPQES